MKVRELSVAVAELDQALTYYGRIETRLAKALLRELRRSKFRPQRDRRSRL